MSDCSGWIVRSKAGHDKGTLLCVVGEVEDFLLLADGKTRKAAAPKRKKRSHVEVADVGTFGHPALEKLRGGHPVFDSELRRALAAFRDQFDGEGGGNSAVMQRSRR